MAVLLDVALTVKSGMEREFEGVVSELALQVLAHEPGASLYQLCRSTDNVGQYRIIEIYADEDALAAHGKSEHFKAASPRLGACLAQPPKIEKFETV